MRETLKGERRPKPEVRPSAVLTVLRHALLRHFFDHTALEINQRPIGPCAVDHPLYGPVFLLDPDRLAQDGPNLGRRHSLFDRVADLKPRRRCLLCRLARGQREKGKRCDAEKSGNAGTAHRFEMGTELELRVLQRVKREEMRKAQEMSARTGW